MKKQLILFLACTCFISGELPAQKLISNNQDTLPAFTVKNAGGGKIIISWVNAYPVVKQISIQRSADSSNFFKSILSVADPMAVQNGYLDARAENDHQFYRLYILLDNGRFLFSKTKRPFTDTSLLKTAFRFDTIMVNGKPMVIKASPFSVKVDSLKRIDSVVIPSVDNNKPKVVPFLPSLYVFTNRDGEVRVKLPPGDKPKKYSIKFYEEDGNFLFELKDIHEKDFRIDKSAFYHAGWFRFELYEDGGLLENHKFFLGKNF